MSSYVLANVGSSLAFALANKTNKSSAKVEPFLENRLNFEIM